VTSSGVASSFGGKLISDVHGNRKFPDIINVATELPVRKNGFSDEIRAGN